MKSKALIFAWLAIVMIQGMCNAGEFRVTAEAGKPWDPKYTYRYTGQNNLLSAEPNQEYLSNSPISNGFFVNPFVYKEHPTGRILEIGFILSNVNNLRYCYHPIIAAQFLINDQLPIQLPLEKRQVMLGNWLSNTNKNPLGMGVFESAQSKVSMEEFLMLINARTVEIEVMGDIRSHTYHWDEIDKSFIPNLIFFYEMHMK